MDHINNAGKKGYGLLIITIVFILLISLLIYVYKQNFLYLPA